MSYDDDTTTKVIFSDIKCTYNLPDARWQGALALYRLIHMQTELLLVQPLPRGPFASRDLTRWCALHRIAGTRQPVHCVQCFPHCVHSFSAGCFTQSATHPGDINVATATRCAFRLFPNQHKQACISQEGLHDNRCICLVSSRMSCLALLPVRPSATLATALQFGGQFAAR